MGLCQSATKSDGSYSQEPVRVLPLDGESKSKVARSSARSNQTRMRTLAMKDIKGFKRSDSIENFYDIQTTIG